MRLTSKGRYAVMALVDLARFNNINPVSLRDISLRQGISLDYLEQIFSKLRKKKTNILSRTCDKPTLFLRIIINNKYGKQNIRNIHSRTRWKT